MQVNVKNKNYYKRIICDYDDTISLTTNRDWKNALPNIPVINKINKLYDQGWEIHIYTARGNLSCSNRDEAEEKYGSGIKEWLAKHEVKYHLLNFNKPIGAYYVDDKALRPDEFVELGIEILQGGMSGAKVERRGNLVYKTADNSLEAAVWYKAAKEFYNVPEIHSVIGNTICMDYVETTSTEYDIDKIHYILDYARGVKPLYESDFSSYYSRIANHLLGLPYERSVLKLISSPSLEKLCNEEKSFSHGDFTLENIIINDGKYYLIDPLNIQMYSSWMLDVAKMLHSLKRHGKDKMYVGLLNIYLDWRSPLLALELTQWVRIRKYSPAELRNRVDFEVNKLIEEIERT
jgi:capsule biosynthesis phosphatase